MWIVQRYLVRRTHGCSSSCVVGRPGLAMVGQQRQTCYLFLLLTVSATTDVRAHAICLILSNIIDLTVTMTLFNTTVPRCALRQITSNSPVNKQQLVGLCHTGVT